jgi:hypothetical protein
MKKTILSVFMMIICIVLFGVSTKALSENEIKELFDKAEEIAGTYYRDKNYEFGSDDTEQYTFFVRGKDRYYFNTKMSPEQMQDLLESLFSDTVIKEIISYRGEETRFIERDGTVYYDIYDFPLFVGDYPHKEFSIKENTENRVVYSMKISRYGNSTEYDYVLEKQADGSWIFTKYHYSNDVIISLERNNPKTSDAPVIAVCALAVSAAAAVVFIKKRR